MGDKMTPQQQERIEWMISSITANTNYETREEQLSFVIGFMSAYILECWNRDSKEYYIFKKKLDDLNKYSKRSKNKPNTIRS